MPEAVAVLLVFVIAVASYVGARVSAANPANNHPAADVQRLQLHRAWLDERLQQAWRENWEHAMLARLAEEIEATEVELTKIVSAWSKTT